MKKNKLFAPSTVAIVYQCVGTGSKHSFNHNCTSFMSSKLCQILWVFRQEGVWVMGFQGVMGVQFPAYQIGGSKMLWDKKGYGLSEVWVMRESTVVRTASQNSLVAA